MSKLTDAKLILTPNGYKAGKLYSLKPFDGTGDFDVVRATTAWRRNASGIWESVANNVPRLHYPVGGGCPSVLVEPQRTNLAPYSNEFENADYTKVRALLTDNNVIGIDGLTSASLLSDDSSGGVNQVFFRRTSNTTVESGNNTFFIFAKAGTLNWVALRVLSFDSSANGFVYFDLENGVKGTEDNITGTIEEESNGFYKCSVHFNTTIDVNGFCSVYLANGNLDLNVNLDGNSNIYITQYNITKGIESTSPIFTNGTTVTRNEDVMDVTTPAGVTEIVETFADGTTNTETIIPATYQLPQGEIKSIVMT